MLARASRLTTGRDFSETIRRGHRAGSRTVVVHLATGSSAGPDVTRAGLVVARTVGNAVTRNRVKRRLRTLVGQRLATLPPGSRLVVRALPASAVASSQELDRDLRGAVERASTKAVSRGGVRS